MERQAIERLAMDAALGELNDDAAALFQAYLTEHPDARRWAAPMKLICERTKEAVVARTAPAVLPPRRAATRVRWILRVRPASVGRWAAVVIVSLALGAVAGRGLVSPAGSVSRRMASAETVRTSMRKEWQAVLNGRDLGFWEAKAAAALQRQPSGGSYEPKPSPWEMLKQRQKERRHAL